MPEPQRGAVSREKNILGPHRRNLTLPRRGPRHYSVFACAASLAWMWCTDDLFTHLLHVFCLLCHRFSHYLCLSAHLPPSHGHIHISCFSFHLPRFPFSHCLFGALEAPPVRIRCSHVFRPLRERLQWFSSSHFITLLLFKPQCHHHHPSPPLSALRLASVCILCMNCHQLVKNVFWLSCQGLLLCVVQSYTRNIMNIKTSHSLGCICLIVLHQVVLHVSKSAVNNNLSFFSLYFSST